MVFKRKRVFAKRPRKRVKRARAMPLVKLVRTHRITRTPTATRFRQGIVRNKRMVTMRYYFYKTHSALTAVIKQQFRANGLFDTDLTGVGAQPRGFDQFMLLYDNYAVTSAKITLNIRNPLNRRTSLFGIRVSDDAAEFDTTAQDIVENKGGTFRFINNMEKGSTIMKFSVNVRKFFGYRGDIGGITDDAAEFQGTAGTDPVKLVYFTLSSVRATATDNDPLDVNGFIDFRVMLINPKKFGGS